MGNRMDYRTVSERHLSTVPCYRYIWPQNLGQVGSNQPFESKMSTASKVFRAEVALKTMGNAPEDSEFTNELSTNPLPSFEADDIVRRARSGPHGRHARMPAARASQGPRVRGWGEHATVYRDVPATATYITTPV